MPPLAKAAVGLPGFARLRLVDIHDVQPGPLAEQIEEPQAFGPIACFEDDRCLDEDTR